jgi:rod shape-determining protein MreD
MIPFAFFLSAIVLWLQSTVYPELPLLAFAPFLALSCLLRSFPKAVLLCCAAGLALDLLSQEHLSLHAMTYTAAAAICFRWRRRFSIETPTQFAIYTALLSMMCTTIQIALLFLFDRRIPFTGRWWMSECLCLPLFDGVYALLWFTGPLALFSEIRRRWVVHWLKKKSLSPN